MTVGNRSFDNTEPNAKACTTQCWNGAIGFVTSSGSLLSLEGLHLRAILPEGYQSPEGSISKLGGILQVGIYALQISGLSTGGSTTVTLHLPGPLPANEGRIFTYHYSAQQARSSGATGETASVTVSDGGPDDSDGQANGQILLLVGPGTSPSSALVRNIGDGVHRAPASFSELMDRNAGNVCYGPPTSQSGGGGGGCNWGFQGLLVLALLLPLLVLARNRP